MLRTKIPRRNRKGQMVALTAVTLPGLLAVSGLVVDGGMIYQMKRRMQTAADAAALGGSFELWRRNTTLVTAAARDDATLNGFTDGANNTTVTVNNPPLSGPRAGDARFVEVIISRDVPTTFLRVVNRNASTVRARAVAGLVRYGGGGCVMALDPDDRGALTIAGNSTLNADCGVMVNSNNDRAIVVDGGGCIYSSEVGVTGGWVANGTQNCINPPPETNIPAAMDPLAYLTPPGASVPVVATKFKMTGGTATLNPGIYRGGIEISGGNVTLNPGTYILDGGGLKITGNPVVRGVGVTFYNTNIGTGGPWGDFEVAGTVQADLVAPDSGPYEGMLFWNDARAPYRNPGSVIAGTSTSRFEGALYFPSTHVTWAGTSTAAAWQMIIARTVKVTGAAVVTSNYGGSTVEPPTYKASLVE